MIKVSEETMEAMESLEQTIRDFVISTEKNLRRIPRKESSRVMQEIGTVTGFKISLEKIQILLNDMDLEGE